jgi:hypothetical protein
MCAFVHARLTGPWCVCVCVCVACVCACACSNGPLGVGPTEPCGIIRVRGGVQDMLYIPEVFNNDTFTETLAVLMGASHCLVRSALQAWRITVL